MLISSLLAHGFEMKYTFYHGLEIFLTHFFLKIII